MTVGYRPTVLCDLLLQRETVVVCCCFDLAPNYISPFCLVPFCCHDDDNVMQSLSKGRLGRNFIETETMTLRPLYDQVSLQLQVRRVGYWGKFGSGAN